MPAARSLRTALTWIVIAALLGTTVWYFAFRDKRKEAPAYRTEALSRGDVTSTVTATGTLSAVTTVQVGSQVSGIIARLYADFNSRVQKGQLLASSTRPPSWPRSSSAAPTSPGPRSTPATARSPTSGRSGSPRKVSRRDGVRRREGGVPGDEAVVRQLEAALSQSETNLRYTKILSPIDGVVVDRQYDVGQTVAASFQAPTLFTIAQDLTTAGARRGARGVRAPCRAGGRRTSTSRCQRPGRGGAVAAARAQFAR